MDKELIIALISWSGAIMAVAIPLLSNFFQMRRTEAASKIDEANAYKIWSDTNETLLERMTQKVEALSRQIDIQDSKIITVTKRVKQLETVIDELYDGANKLFNQVQALGADPVYVPPKSLPIEKE